MIFTSGQAMGVILAVMEPARIRQDEELATTLLRRVAAGDPAAFERLYHQTRAQVARTLSRLVGTGPELEDCMQQTYLELLQAAGSFRGEAQASTFLYRICANVGVSALRRRARRREVPELAAAEPADPNRDPERDATVSQAAALMERALDSLAPERRVIFVYHELLGLFPEEIAQALDLRNNTVRSRLNRAREDFAKALTRLKAQTRSASHG